MPLPSRVADLALRHVRRARPLLGTRVEIGVTGAGSDESLHAAIDAGFAAIERVHSLMSYHDSESELSRLNRDAAAGWRDVDTQTYRVIEAALQFAALSKGAFDPTVAPHLEAWGYLPRINSATAPGATWRDVEIERGERVRYHRPLRLDLGGIAKGYAVDRAVEALLALGIENIMVNAGGDLKAAGPMAQQVQLRHPADPFRIAGQVIVQNEALATSAAYFSRSSVVGRETSALVDARSGKPHVGDESFSVFAPDCMTADALAKVLMFAEAAIAERALANFNARARVLFA